MKSLVIRLVISTHYLLFALVLLCFITSKPAKAQALTGTDFWFTFPDNGFSDFDGPDFYFYIISQYCIDSVEIDIPLYQEKRYISLEPGQFNQQRIPYQQGPFVIAQHLPDEIYPKGIHISSPKPIAVFAFNYSQKSSDGETVIPTNLLGTKYVTSMRANSNIGPIRTIVLATQNNTTVNINAWKSGVPFQETLNMQRGQTYMWESAIDCKGDYGFDIDCERSTTGVIESTDPSKPIVVIESVDCANIGPCGNCDMMMANYLPESNWGTEHVLPQILARNPYVNYGTGDCDLGPSGNFSVGDYAEIVGKIGTKVSINSANGIRELVIPKAAAPNASEEYGYLLYENKVSANNLAGDLSAYLTSSEPVQVVQYVKGFRLDSSKTADPEALVQMPVNTWSSSLFFYPVESVTSTSLEITVVIKNVGQPAPISTVLINGDTLSADGWLPLGNSAYRFKRVTFQRPVPSSVLSYAGYPLGLYFYAGDIRETAIFSGGYGPLDQISLCDQCAEIDIVAEGNFCENESLQFNARRYAFTQPSNLRFNWNFGDGISSNLENPAHLFTKAGKYAVSLSVISSPTCTLQVVKQVQVNKIELKLTPKDTQLLTFDQVPLFANATSQPQGRISRSFYNTQAQAIPNNGIDQFWDGVSGSLVKSAIQVSEKFKNWQIDSVCVNISHGRVKDLQAALQLPDGSSFLLFQPNDANSIGRSGFRKSCFGRLALANVDVALAPFTGLYAPVDSSIWSASDLINPQGKWTLSVGDDSITVEGVLLDWSLHLTADNEINQYQWVPGTNLSDANIFNPILSPSDSTKYIVTVNDAAACSATDTMIIRARRGAKSLFPVIRRELCSKSAVLNLNQFFPFDIDTSGIWQAEGQKQVQQNKFVTINAGETGTFLFKYALPFDNGKDQGVDSAYVELVVLNPPNLGLPGLDSLCSNSGVLNLFGLLQGTPDQGGNFSSQLGPSNNVINVNAYYDEQLVLYYRKQVADCPADSTPVYVYVTGMPQLAFAESNIVVCQGDSVSIGASCSGCNYSWSTGDLTSSIFVSQANKYTLSATKNQCIVSADLQVNVQNPPQLNIGNDTTICDNDSLLINAQIIGGTYLWNTSESSFSIVARDAQYYLVNVQIGVCKVSDSLLLSLIPAPLIGIGDTLVCPEDVVVLDVSQPNVAFRWSDGSRQPIRTVFAGTNYMLSARNIINGCNTIASIGILLSDTCLDDVYVPNAFTPDGDNFNDNFIVVAGNVNIKLLTIYNRWGEPIFTTGQENKAWDGTYNGLICPSGLYLAIVDYVNVYQEHKTIKVSFSLLR